MILLCQALRVPTSNKKRVSTTYEQIDTATLPSLGDVPFQSFSYIGTEHLRIRWKIKQNIDAERKINTFFLEYGGISAISERAGRSRAKAGHIVFIFAKCLDFSLDLERTEVVVQHLSLD